MSERKSKKQNIWDYIKFYKFKSIFLKNLFIVSVVILLPLIISNMVVRRYYNEVIEDEIGQAYESSLHKVRDIFDLIISETEKVGLAMSTEADIHKYLDDFVYPKDGGLDFDSVKMLQNIMQTASVYATGYIESIYVYSELAQEVMSSEGFIQKVSTYKDNDWVKTYNEKKLTEHLWVEARDRKESKTLGEAHLLSFFYTAPLLDKVPKGAIIINLNADKLLELIGNLETKEGVTDNLFIINNDGYVVVNEESLMVNRHISRINLFDSIVMDKEEGSVVQVIDGIDTVISYTTSKYNGWKIVSVIPLTVYEDKIGDLERLMNVFMIGSIILVLIIAFVISIRLYTPIRNIMSIMENPSEWGRYAQNNEGISSEMRYISSNIIQSFDENKEMEEALAQRLELLKKSQTAALQAQINPHFLYNTLQAINWLAMDLTGSENKATDVIGSLSQLLRVSMETDDHIITFEDEFKHAKMYVEIQGVRYQNKFDVEWFLDEAIKQCKVLKFTLQPLIENSIYHGLKPKKGKGLIRVKAYLVKSEIHIRVTDDGVGMSLSKMEGLNEKFRLPPENSNEHIGATNVNQRLKLVFGEHYGMKVASNNGEGLIVSIVIPKVE